MNDFTDRRPVWLALSELYLDTELQEEDYTRIVKVLRASNFSLEEIESIHRYEVCPVLHINLFSVAGEWVAFNEAQLYKDCTRSFLRRHNFWHRLNANLAYWSAGRAVWRPLAEKLRPAQT